MMSVGPSLPAQEPPAHLPACEADSTARAFLGRTRYLLARADSTERARLGLVAPEGEVTLVTEEPVCLAAAAAYARYARGPVSLVAPFPVAVVRAGDRYFVQLGGVGGNDAPRWEVVVFDPTFRPVARE